MIKNTIYRVTVTQFVQHASFAYKNRKKKYSYEETLCYSTAFPTIKILNLMNCYNILELNPGHVFLYPKQPATKVFLVFP